MGVVSVVSVVMVMVEEALVALLVFSFPAQPISFRENGRGRRVKSRITSLDR